MVCVVWSWRDKLRYATWGGIRAIDECDALALYVEAQGLIRAEVELRGLEKGKFLNSAQVPSLDRNEA